MKGRLYYHSVLDELIAFERLLAEPPPAGLDEQDDAVAASGCLPVNSIFKRPNVRPQLQVICALYAQSATSAERSALLDRLEGMTLETATTMVLDLLKTP